MESKESFRKAWAQFPTGVSIITTRDHDGAIHGMTANGIASVSLDPPLVLVCAGHTTNTYQYLQRQGQYGMSFLREDQEEVARYYARRPADRHPPAPAQLVPVASGYVKVEGCLAFMECQVIATHEHGDHTIFVAEVEEIQIEEGLPLLFYGSRYHRLPGHPR